MRPAFETRQFGIVTTALVALGVTCIAALVATALILTSRIDQQTQEDTRLAHLQIFDTWAEDLRNLMDDYAFWTDALRMVESGDPDEIYENIGISAENALLFDRIILLSPDGEVLFAYGPNGPEPAARLVDDVHLAPFLDALQATNPEDYPILDGTSAWQDGVARVAVARITPYPEPPPDRDALPIMVGVNLVNTALFERMATATWATEFRVTMTEGLPDAIGLQGTDGVAMAWLTWTPRTPGTELRAELWPILSLICLVILGLVAATGVFFRRQADLLRTARRIAETDALTGLLNRAGLQNALESAEVRARLSQAQYAVLTVDLNDFKALNDRYGHPAGDHVLQTVASRILAVLRPGDCAARVGGDEFIGLIFDEDPTAAAKQMSAALACEMHKPIAIDTEQIDISSAIGIAVAQLGAGWTSVLAASDAAMYRSKGTGAPITCAAQVPQPAAAGRPVGAGRPHVRPGSDVVEEGREGRP